MKELEINTALNAIVAGMALSTPRPVAWDDREFTPPEDGIYIEAFQIPNDQTSLGWGLGELSRGIYRLGVIVPANSGPNLPLSIAAEVITYFPKNRRVWYAGGSLQFYDQPSIGASIKDGQKTIYPITILYQDFH